MAEKICSGILPWLAAGLILGMAVSLLFLQQAVPVAPAPAPQANWTKEAAGIEILLINPQDCPACRPLDQVLPQLEEVAAGMNLTVSSARNASAAEGAALIAKYNITRLPSMVVTGNYSAEFASDWTGGAGTKESDGALVLRNIYPPYYENGKVVGVVRGTVIAAPNCTACLDPERYYTSLEDPQVDMKFSTKSVLQENDAAAQALIVQYNITKLPVLLLSEDAGAYDVFGQYLLPLGEIRGGWFILRNVTPPYVDLQTGRVHGLVETIFIVNSSCTDCFDASDLSAYLVGSGGMALVKNTTYEANSTAGKELIAKYKLRNLPALLYSPDASAYYGFSEAWLAEGETVESDGWHVFRAYESLAVPYQNISG
ncbi:MAG: hypothetical protein PHV13_05540 [Candidatus ainarchaeum sp.]|nr:hypothetical protein [Candidatus ainarchaeum sp.]